ncbi:MAG: hypothetical protein IT429_09125 [Gemmataceae bacterium]|nr:hypothetical protein [Gemmataceae bacterium]
MTRRTGHRIVAAWVCAGLLSGCSLVDFKSLSWGKKPDPAREITRPEVRDQPPAGAGVDDPQGMGVAAVGGMTRSHSPYSPTVNRLLSPGPRTDPRILQAIERFPDAPPVPDPAPPQNAPPPFYPVATHVEPQPALVPPEPKEPLVVALDCLLKDDLKKAEAVLAELQDSDGAIKRVLLALRDLNSSKGQPSPEELAVVLGHLQDGLLALRLRSRLVIQHMCFCEQIDGFKTYKEVPKQHRFQAACEVRPDQRLPGERVLLYVELRNVGLRNVGTAASGPCYEMRLRSKVEIKEKGASGRSYKYDLKAQTRPLRSPNLFSECYHSYSFYVPPIPPGEYSLILRVWDESTDPPRPPAVAEVPFVVAPNALCGN